MTDPWPFTPLESQARFNEEVQFFDDILACIGAHPPWCSATARTGMSSGGCN